jgi:hypothetical protein
MLAGKELVPVSYDDGPNWKPRRVSIRVQSVFNPWLRLRFATANTNQNVVSRGLTLTAAVLRLFLECERPFRKADRPLQLVSNRSHKSRRAPWADRSVGDAHRRLGSFGLACAVTGVCCRMSQGPQLVQTAIIRPDRCEPRDSPRSRWAIESTRFVASTPARSCAGRTSIDRPPSRGSG